MSYLDSETVAIMNSKMGDLKKDVDALKEHRMLCDLQHKQNEEHKRRSDDAMNNLTKSNLTLAQSIIDTNITLTKLIAKVDKGDTAINIVANAATAWKVNKIIFLTVVALASGAVAIATAYEHFF